MFWLFALEADAIKTSRWHSVFIVRSNDGVDGHGGHVGSLISTREQENPVDDDSVGAHAPLEIEDDVKCQPQHL